MTQPSDDRAETRVAEIKARHELSCGERNHGEGPCEFREGGCRVCEADNAAISDRATLLARVAELEGERQSGVVRVKHTDSVQIEDPDGRSVQIPAWMILAADKVLRYMLINTESLSMDPAEDETSRGWECCLDAPDETAFGNTPWGALVAMSHLIVSKEQRSV